MRELPIPRFLGLEVAEGSLSESELRSFQEQQLREAEEITSACMQAKGWAYEPRRFRFLDPGRDASETPGTRSWVAKYGFGISTLMFSQEMVGSELVGYRESGSNVEVEDPNEDYVASLGSDAAEAYRIDLIGEDRRFDSVDADLPAVLTSSSSFEGCRGEANDATGLSLGSRYEQELSDLARRAHADDEVVSFVAEVRRCVAEAGHPFYGMPIGLDGHIPYADEIQEIGRLAATTMQEEAPGDTDSTGNIAVPLGPDARSALAELQAREVSEALAVYDCGGTPEALNEVVDMVIPSYERAWIVTNQDQLLEFKAQIAEIRDRYGLPPLDG